MGSDGIDAPGQFEAHGAYVSGFPVDASSPVYKAFTKAHKGQPETFGLPTYTSIWANATAIKMACKAGHGKTTRKAVRKDLLKVKLTAKQSLLGFPVQFLNKNKGTFQGPGDMGGLADFADLPHHQQRDLRSRQVTRFTCPASGPLRWAARVCRAF